MKTYLAAIVVLIGVAPARADLMPFAQYDWQNGAADVSGSVIQHDGVLEPGASVAGGKLALDGWDGVQLGYMPELDGATEVLLRFKDLTFTRPVERYGANAAVLAGDSDSWWVAVYRYNYTNTVGTSIEFVLGGYGPSDWLQVHVSNRVIDHFDSIEYRLNPAAPLDERFSIRWNDGPWVTGGTGADIFGSIPSADQVHIHNGRSSDADPISAMLGPVSFYSNQIPEPSTVTLLSMAVLGLLTYACRTRRGRR